MIKETPRDVALTSLPWKKLLVPRLLKNVPDSRQTTVWPIMFQPMIHLAPNMEHNEKKMISTKFKLPLKVAATFFLICLSPLVALCSH